MRNILAVGVLLLAATWVVADDWPQWLGPQRDSSSTETDKTLWQVDTTDKYKAPGLTFGCSCSPIVVGDRVIVNIGAKGASIVAFDKNTGKEVWKALDDRASYSSPITIGQGETTQVIFLA